MALAFAAPVDICNRALQHLGQAPITAADFQVPTSKQGRECNTCYDKLRVAELGRNCWTFSTRRAVLRALDSTSKLWAPPAYSASTSYAAYYVVAYNGDYWQAQPGVATGDKPGVATTWMKYFGPIVFDTYNSTIAYWPGEIVISSSTIYLSLISNNTDTPPTSNWLALGGTSAAVVILYPIGAGPLSQTNTANVYRLPYGYLREAPQNPKGDINPRVGGPGCIQTLDWLIENPYLISGDPGPIMLRCVADITDVTLMSTMFCEGTAARMGYEMCEALTQAQDKQATCERAYKTAMGDARTVNGIEAGFVDPPEDEFITVRR